MAAAHAPAALTGSVGTGGLNRPADIGAVQVLLNRHRGGLPRIAEDSRIGPETVGAIAEFQRRVVRMPAPDGRVDVGGRTWQALVGGAAGQPPPPPARPTAAGGFLFPMSRVHTNSWQRGAGTAGYFGCNRSGGARAHAGCDLYAPVGTPLHAIADGVVTAGPYDFYCHTQALEVDFGTLLARYGEIRPGHTLVRQGDKVTAGQALAQVGHLVGIKVPSDMLHFELYSKAAHGPLTVYSGGKVRGDGVPYQRRSDLLDPTHYLDQWRNHLPSA